MSTPEPRPDASATADETQTSTRRVDTIWLVGISSILLLTLLPFSSYIASVPFVRDAYLITSLVGLLGILIAFLMARGKHEPDQTVSVDSEQALPQKAGRLDLTVLLDKSVALVNVAYALHTAELYLARLWLPILLGATFVSQGTDPVTAASLAATLAGFMFMTGIAGVFVGGYLSDRIGRTAGAAMIFAVSGACSFAAGWLVGWTPALLIGIGFVYGFITAADSAIYSTAVTELSLKNRIGSAQAVQSFVGFTVGATAPVLAGTILDLARSASGWGLAFSFNGLLAVIGVAALLWLRRLPKAAQMAAGKR